MGIVDGFFESKDAIGKSEGMMATMVNAVVGAIGGFIDGAIFQLLDLLKSGISWIAGFFGFDEVEKFLDSFSFSEMFNKFLDGIYSFVNALFKWETYVTFFDKAVSYITGTGKGSLLGSITALMSGISDWFMGLFDFSSMSGVIASTINILFMPYTILFDLVTGIWNWFAGLFGFDKIDTTKSGESATSAGGIGGLLVNLVSGVWTWFKGLFGWGGDKEPVEQEEGGILSYLTGIVTGVWTWFKGLFADPVAGLTTLLASIAAGYLTILDFITAPLKKGIAWILRLFGWDEAAESTETFSFKDTIMGVFESAKKWIMGLFSWSQEPVKEGDSFIVKTIKGVVTTVKDWFGNMFKFDSTGDALKSILNIMMWIPNLLVKAMLGVTSFVAGLLGFDEKSKDLATAGKDFSFGDLIGKGLKALADWLGGMFDIDMAALGRSVLGDTLYGFLFGDTADAQIMAKKKEIEMHKKELKEGDTRTAMGFSREGEIEDLEKAIAKLEKEKAVVKPATSKPIIDVAKTAKTIAAPAKSLGVGGWREGLTDSQLREKYDLNPRQALNARAILSAKRLMRMRKGQQAKITDTRNLQEGGLVTETGLAMLHGTIPKPELVLDNQAASVFMKAAQLLTGSQLLEQSRSDGGGGQPVIVNNNNVDNSVKSSSRQNISVPESVRQNESTLRALQAA